MVNYKSGIKKVVQYGIPLALTGIGIYLIKDGYGYNGPQNIADLGKIHYGFDIAALGSVWASVRSELEFKLFSRVYNLLFKI